MTVAWNPPEEDGGLEVSGYIIERKEVRSDRWVRANKNPITMTRYRSTELIEGLEYEHRVIALNAKGLSKPSLPSKPAVATDPIGEKFGEKDLISLSLYSQTKATRLIFVFSFHRSTRLSSEPKDYRYHKDLCVIGLEPSR